MNKFKSKIKREKVLREKTLPIEEKEAELVRCEACPERAGLKDDYTLCPECKGKGYFGYPEE